MNRFLQDIRLGGQQVITPVEGGGTGEQVSDLLTYNSIFSSSNFVGSYTVTSVKKDYDIIFYVYNVTGVSSGSAGKHFDSKKDWPKSVVREKGVKTPFGNISQMFKIVIPINQLIRD